MNEHPWRETADEKPQKMIHDNDRPDDDATHDGKTTEQGSPADDSTPPTMQPISREAAERGIAPDKDPDDSVSP